MTSLRTACLASALALALTPAHPQLLLPGSAIEVVETGSFSIYFPPSLEAEARRVAGFADSVLETEIGRFGPKPDRKLSVLLADASPEQNGYFTSLPSSRIVLEIAPSLIDEELASAPDPLKALFAHELAHALSLSTRDPFFGFGAALFGDPVAPAFWLGPRLLAEGTAIAAESGSPGEGKGRSTDPLSAAPVIQSLAEGRRPGFWEADGAGGAWPFGSSPYAFGGPFADWLERRYGAGSLEKLWIELAQLRPPENFLFVKGAFSAAFGKDLPSLWKDYLDDMTPRYPILVGPRIIAQSGPAVIVGLTARKGLTLWADAAEGAVFSLADGQSAPSRLFDVDGHVNRLDISDDGRFLLVSTAAPDAAGNLRELVLVRDLKSGRFTARRVRNLREAAWVGDAGADGSGDIVGIAPRGVQTDLALAHGTDVEVILRGGPTRSYGSPVSLDGDAVAFLVRDGGTSMLARLKAGAVEVLAPSQALPDLRFLSGSHDRLAAAFAAPKELYRLVIVEHASTESPQTAVQAVGLSGGIERPVFRSEPQAAPAVGYVASLSGGQWAADYPFDLPALALARSPASWVPLDSSFARGPGSGAPSPDTASGATPSDAPRDLGTPASTPTPAAGATSGISTTPATMPAPTFAAGATSASPPAPAATSQREALPFAPRRAPPFPDSLEVMRFPYVTPTFDAAGLFVQGGDLTESLSWAAIGAWNWGAGGADLAAAAQLSIAAWTLAIQASDNFTAGLISGTWWRSSVADLSLSRFFATFPARRGMSLEAEAAGGAISTAPSGSPYSGSLVDAGVGSRAGLGWTDSHQSAFAPFEKRGYKTSLAVDGEFSSLSGNALAATIQFEGWLPFGGLDLLLGGTLSPYGLAIGPSGRYFEMGAPSFLSASQGLWPLYSGLGLAAPWYATGDLSARLFDIEIGTGLGLLPVEARRLIARTGFRAGALGDFGARLPTALVSAYADLSFEFSPKVGLFASESLAATVEGEWSPFLFDGAQVWRLSFALGAGH